MKKIFVLFCLILFILCGTGCGATGSYEISRDELGMEVCEVKIEDNSIVNAEVLEDGILNITSNSRGTTVITVKNSYGETMDVNVKVKFNNRISVDFEKFEKPVNSVNAADYGLSTEAEDNAAAFQAAIDALPDGGVVYVPKGIYKTSFIQLKEGITLKLEGVLSDYNVPYSDEIASRVNNGEFAVIQATGTYMIMNHEILGWGRTGAGNFAVTGGVIDMEGKARGFILSCADNVLLENVIMKDCKNDHAIQVTGSKNVTIRNVMFAGYNLVKNSTTAEVIQIEEAQPVSTGSSKVHENLSNFEDYEYYSSENITIENCYFGKSDEYGAPTFPIGHHGCVGKYCAVGITIKDCTFDNPLACAIRAYGWKDVEISGCSFISESSSTSVTEEHCMIEMNIPTAKDVQLLNGAYLVRSYERGGVDNLNIHDNSFVIGESSNMQGALKTLSLSLTYYNIDAKAESNLLVTDSYDDKPYSFSGYKLVNNRFSNVRFCDNMLTIENGVGSKYLYLYNIKGVEVTGNTPEASTKSIKNCISSEDYQRSFVVSATSANTTAPIVLSGGDTDIDAYCTAASTTDYYNLTISCEGEGGINRSVSTDGTLSISAVADDGYTFAGYYVNDTKLTETTFNFTEATQVVAKFTRN